MFGEDLPVTEGKLLKGRQTDDGETAMAGMCRLLREGEIADCKPLPRGSNDVFRLFLRHNGRHIPAIYKPRQGETPLYDFPLGTLYRREYAAYLVSQALRWYFVPPTVIRDGPFGVGMVQSFIITNPAVDYTTLLKKRSREFQRVVTFDWLANNADRKGSHCLDGLDGKLWLIDHGLTFHAMPKLRTVLWDFSGQPVPEEILADLEQFHHRLNGDTALLVGLHQLLSPVEVKALEERLMAILKRPVFPDSFGSYYRWPYPPF